MSYGDTERRTRFKFICFVKSIGRLSHIVESGKLEQEDNMDKFYKLARPDGWDFFTGETINYRDNIGREVVCPEFDQIGQLCSTSFIHASREPNLCFSGASIPCSAFLVKGTPILEDRNKAGFKELFIEKEIKNKNEFFGWNYNEAINPLNPLKIKSSKVNKKHLKLLEIWISVSYSVGDSVWGNVGVRVWDSVWDNVGKSVWESVTASVNASAWDSILAYVGSLYFPIFTKRDTEYQYQSCVELWKGGFVPSFDGKTWRLHGGEKAAILWESKK
jgi:hypothetical protein